MDSDEREICIYLKSFPGQFISGKEIARRAGGKNRFRNEPDWAVPALGRLVEKAILEDDQAGHFRLKPRDPKDKKKAQRFISPAIRKILEGSGKTFDIKSDLDDPTEEF